LVEQEVFGGGIIFSGNADPFEKDLSWLDDSSVEDISDDGSKILFDETGDAAGSTHGVYLRNTDGSPAIRLADGYAGQISPDGKWVLSFSPTFPSQLVMTPTGPGESRVLSLPNEHCIGALWLHDGHTVGFVTGASTQQSKLYELDLATQKRTEILPEG